MSCRSTTPLLDTVSLPSDLRKLQPVQLRKLADELPTEVISAVDAAGGHLGSGPGVVELAKAIHHLFDTPRDRLVWDVGHQCYLRVDARRDGPAINEVVRSALRNNSDELLKGSRA